MKTLVCARAGLPCPVDPNAKRTFLMNISEPISMIGRSYLREQERTIGSEAEATRDPFGARLKAASLTACRGAWEFLKAVGEVRARKDMLDVAKSIAVSRPELAARLRRAARGGGWSEQ